MKRTLNWFPTSLIIPISRSSLIGCRLLASHVFPKRIWKAWKISNFSLFQELISSKFFLRNRTVKNRERPLKSGHYLTAVQKIGVSFIKVKNVWKSNDNDVGWKIPFVPWIGLEVSNIKYKITISYGPCDGRHKPKSGIYKGIITY